MSDETEQNVVISQADGVDGVQELVYRKTTVPSVQFQNPPITSEVQLEEYGIDQEDQILQDVAPPQYQEPGLDTNVPYSNDFLVGAANPIGRQLNLTRALEGVPNDEIVIVSNRHNLRQLLDNFAALPSSQYDINGFPVIRIGNVIYFGDPHEQPHPILFEDSREAYGKPFEKLCTPGVDPRLSAYYQYRRYRLLDAVTLVVRSEIDAVDEQGKYVEIKTTQWSIDHNPTGTQRFLRRAWVQAFLGRADRVLVGYLAVPNNSRRGANRPPATLRQYRRSWDRRPTTLATSKLRELARISQDSLTGFASLLVWVRENVADGDRLELSYAKESEEFTLRHQPQA